MAKALEDQEMEAVDRPETGDQLRFLPYPRRVRAFLGGQAIADSTNVILLLERNHLPVYYFPAHDVRMDLAGSTSKSTRCPYKGEASYWSVTAGGKIADNAMWGYETPIDGAEPIKGHVAFYWNKIDAWFEEDDEVYAHPRDPFHRVDVLNSSRHVRVVVGGHTVAETRDPRLLFETGLPIRYYIPKVDVRLDLLEPTDTKTRCPYKGEASYWSVNAGGKSFKDFAWTYVSPIPECSKIENLVCFFNERVQIFVDGEEMDVPTNTPWS